MKTLVSILLIVMASIFANAAEQGEEMICLNELKSHAQAYQTELNTLSFKCKKWMNKPGKKSQMGAMMNCAITSGDRPPLEAIRDIKESRIITCRDLCEDIDLGEPAICNGNLGLQTWIDLVDQL